MIQEKKICNKCKQLKFLNNFGREKKSFDGRRSICKDCRAEYQREYYHSGNGKSVNERYFLSEKGRVAKREGQKRYKKRYPKKVKAGKAVEYAIRQGHLLHPSDCLCAICSSRNAEHYHHYMGYEKDHWLDVMPVCISCHNDIHN